MAANTLAEAKRAFCHPRDRDRSKSLAEAKQNMKSPTMPAREVNDARVQGIREQRSAVAALTQELQVTHAGLFDDLFVGDVDAVTQLPSPPSVEALRRLHKEQEERDHAQQASSELTSLMHELAGQNRSRGLDGVSSIRKQQQRHPKAAGAVALAEVECQVLLSYVMQACAALDPEAQPAETREATAVGGNSTLVPGSLNATSIAGGGHLVAHTSRVAGGRLSSSNSQGTKSTPHAPSASRSRSTPSSGNGHSSSVIMHHSVVSDAHSQPASGSPRGKSSSSTRGSRSMQQPDVSGRSMTSPDASDFGFETRGNVRFDETSIAAAAAQRNEHDDQQIHGDTESDSDPKASAPGPGTSASATEMHTELPSAAGVSTVEKSHAKSEPSIHRKPTAKFAPPKSKKTSRGWCMGNDAA